MDAVSHWLKSKFENPHTLEEKEVARVSESYKLSLALTQQRNEPVKAIKGWTNPVKKAYFADKLEDVTTEGTRYTFQVTTRANCYESVLTCLDKGEPARHYTE